MRVSSFLSNIGSIFARRLFNLSKNKVMEQKSLKDFALMCECSEKISSFGILADFMKRAVMAFLVQLQDDINTINEILKKY